MWIGLLVSFAVSGILCGMMLNVALGRKAFELGGVMGGLVSGLLMLLI
jgi:hypothetical protein